MIAPRNKVPNKGAASKNSPDGFIKWAVIGLITIAVLIGVFLYIPQSDDANSTATNKKPVARSVLKKRDVPSTKKNPLTQPRQAQVTEGPQIEDRRCGRGSKVQTSSKKKNQ